MIIDCFAGPAGWDLGARAAGLGDPLGLEIDRDACASRALNGLPTVRCDVTTWEPERLRGRVEGLIASPPCTDFSLAGKRAGIEGETGRLMREVPRWVEAARPRWVACEQVPPALEWWHRFATDLQRLGYATWCGILNAADFGVAQTRRRAILLASLDRRPGPPEPTHAREPGDALLGQRLPWVSMAEALGWSETTVNTRGDRTTPGGNEFGADGPSWALTEKARSWKIRTGKNSRVASGSGDWRETHAPYERSCDEPSPTIDAIARVWTFDRPATSVCGDSRLSPPGHHDADTPNSQHGPGTVKLTVADALILQSFPPGYPVHGTKTSRFRQIGNAIPVTLARVVLDRLV